MAKHLLKPENRNLVCYFPRLQLIHITKDVVQIPNAIAESYSYKAFIATNQIVNDAELKKYAPHVDQLKLKNFYNEDRKKIKHNAKFQLIKALRKRFQKYYFVFFMFINLRKIDYLYLYNFGPTTNFDVAIFGIFYKIFNPKGLLHVRLEIGVSDLSKTFPIIQKSGIKTYFLNILYRNFVKKTSILGIIDDKDFSGSKSYPIFWNFAKNKLKQQLNGYNIIFKEKIKSFEEKEDIICIVGRLYSVEKGLKILLESLKSINLKGWKLFLIGELDDLMEKYIDAYLNENEALRDKVIIIGNVIDKELYYSYLNRSKIFCAPYSLDGISLALVEAMGFGNIPVVTDFPGYRICTENGKFGVLFPLNNITVLSRVLQNLIDDAEKTRRYSQDIKKFSEESLKWGNIIKSLDIQNCLTQK